jgi:hypothetical protein
MYQFDYYNIKYLILQDISASFIRVSRFRRSKNWLKTGVVTAHFSKIEMQKKALYVRLKGIPECTYNPSL